MLANQARQPNALEAWVESTRLSKVDLLYKYVSMIFISKFKYVYDLSHCWMY